ncbi:MAG: sigma-54 dependent transcriptional regulator [Planctomycetota bacterium]
MPVLLIVDDEPSILHFFRRAFDAPSMTVVTAASAAEGIALASQIHPDVIILDINLGDDSGLNAFRRIREQDPKALVIFVTGHGTTATAIEAMRLGAFDYLLKPLEIDHVTELVHRACEISRLMRVPAVIAPSPDAGDASDILIGKCPAMQDVYKLIGRVAPQEMTALILGESGTGKELVARAIYHYSQRARGPFLAINCAAIPESLLESELFGHERGAFSGADRQRIGKFEQCRGGTLFLDEIGDMTPLTQAKILRVLQGQSFERVGGNEPIQTDVRLIAATNRDLETMVADGRFRGDLYYRLNVCPILLPPLRERGEDLALLAEHFVQRFNRELGRSIHTIAPQTLEILKAYRWPGNVRQLQSVLKQALLAAAGTTLIPEFLPAVIQGREARGNVDDLAGLTRFIQQSLRVGAGDLYAEYQTLTERHLFSQVIEHARGNLSQAARLLGIARATLRTKLHSLGIAPSGEARGDDTDHDSP